MNFFNSFLKIRDGLKGIMDLLDLKFYFSTYKLRIFRLHGAYNAATRLRFFLILLSLLIMTASLFTESLESRWRVAMNNQTKKGLFPKGREEWEKHGVV